MNQLPLFVDEKVPPRDEWTDHGLPEDVIAGPPTHDVGDLAPDKTFTAEELDEIEGESPSTRVPPFVAFDLEIARPFETGRPYGISCAATLTNYGDLVLWHGAEKAPGATLPEQMNPREVQEMAGYLLEMQAQGYAIVGWNSLGFDFDVLAEECRNPLLTADIAKLAMEHVDPAFQMLCDRGYMVGLETAGKGLGVGAKTEGMHGHLAPILWNGWPADQNDDLDDNLTRMRAEVEALGLPCPPGRRTAQDLCLEYVAQDAKLTADVYAAIVEGKHLPWIARSGRPNTWHPKMAAGRLLTVNECLQIPEPDTSWMSKPRLRSDLLAWIEEIS